MDQNNNARAVFGYYWKRARKYPLWVTGVIFSLPLAILLNSYIPPLILANVLSRLSRHDYIAHHIWASFGTQLVWYVLVLFAGMAAWRLVDHFVWKLEGYIGKDIAEEVLDHMLKMSTDFHTNNFTGSLVSQANKLLTSYGRAADTTIFSVYPLVSGILIAAVILGPRAPLFVLLLVLSSAAFIALAFVISKPVRQHGARTAAFESRQTGYLADAITNVVAIKSFSNSQYESRRFRKATATTRDSLFQLAKAHQRQMNSLGVLSRSMGGLALFIAVVSVMVFNINIATVFLIFSYTSSIVDQLFNFGNQALRNYNRSIGDAYDMVSNLAMEPTVQDPKRPEKSRISKGRVVFKDVEFDHEAKDAHRPEPLFRNFNLEIAPGEKIGLVGHSGGGKTTLTKLILRFMDIDKGEILIDGQNIANITQDDLRRSITYVPQEPLLFHRTLAENIGYGKADASQKDIVRAAKLAHAHEFIKDLPGGYETLVGERGIKLSGGQRQRIAIARAMLKEAPILVLDEATSALDSESEKLIQEALWKLMESKTAVVIAHRLSTVQRMDRIVVLDEGRIVEQGSHKELLAVKGTYAKLWAHQSGGFLEE
jgi:ATP-binding cassette subfamily B protein